MPETMNPASPRLSQVSLKMESVPETERLDDFKPSPLPTLRLQSPASLSAPDLDIGGGGGGGGGYAPRKPPNTRRSTEPISPSSPPSWLPPTSLPYRPRTASPLSTGSGGGHSRSKSVHAGTASAPPMSRTQSMPGVSGSGHLLYSPQATRPASPSGSSASGSPSRIRLPRRAVDEIFPTSPTRQSVLAEPGEGGRILERKSSPNLGVASAVIGSIPRHRRPSSPLRWGSTGSLTSTAGPSTPTSASSPSLRSFDTFPPPQQQQQQQQQPCASFSASFPSSSVPSTPTSARSRSPSISSLETIPDSPDAEKAALEEEARMAAMAAAATESAADGKKSAENLDVPTRGRTLGLGPRDKRKRWSVCGAERRGDLDLETIWED